MLIQQVSSFFILRIILPFQNLPPTLSTMQLTTNPYQIL